ncbi:MAG: hypothetical protein HQM16_12445 [Deltaproteobacteria bacterium]|nr:hypothetical protein [Deltaproteobacteria bacterium]
MKKICQMICVLFLLLPLTARAAMDISPQSQTELLGLLMGLAEDHANKKWCRDSCGQIHFFKLSGRISDGELAVEIMGSIIGDQQGVLPLFGSVPAADILELKNETADVPLVFYNKAYYTFLKPGPFRLLGRITIEKNASTNFTLPGAVGKIELAIPDQEPLLDTVRWGQVGNSFQVVSKTQKNMTAEKEKKKDLRLGITRSYHVARDKTFVYSIHVIGAHVGQVISIPVTRNEKVLETTPPNAKISADKVDFTATGSENYFTIEGEWIEAEIKLTALAGTVKETWQVNCEGAYDCLFSGDVEKSVSAEGHEWIPVAGQTLHVTWKELGLARGQSIVAQEVLLDTHYSGDGLKQKLKLNLKSSAADHVYVGLPKESIPVALHYGGVPSPILKNKEDLVHLTVPQGETNVELEWETAFKKAREIPVPGINLPSGKWVFWVEPNKNENVIWAGGLPGSPVVLFWPRLGFCLLIALLFLFTEKKLLKEVETKGLLFVVLGAGFALGSTLDILFVLGFVAVIRLLKRVKKQRNIFGWIFEGLVVLALVCLVLVACMDLLDLAFFTASPFDHRDFCSANPVVGQYKPLSSLCWEVTTLKSVSDLSAPSILVLPTMVVRVIYFCWAIAGGFYFYFEMRNLWSGIKHYYSLGLKPFFKSRAKV